MNNFVYETPTKVYFGKGGVREYLNYLLKMLGIPLCLHTVVVPLRKTASMMR